MKLIGLVLVFKIMVIASGLSQQIPETKIWDKAPHNAFTDLVRFKSHFYCAFREGKEHLPVNGINLGKIRILRSKDGKKWDSVALFDIGEYDLRDPKLSVTPDNKLMVLIGGSKYFRKIKVGAISYVSFSKNGLDFTDPEAVNIEDKIKSRYDWIWRITWYKGVGYGVVYQDPKLNNNYLTKLVKTKDGVNFQIICDFYLNNRPNEATIRFTKDGEMFVLVRRENLSNGVLGISKVPYTKWKWVDMSFRLGGPNFEIFDNGTLCIGTRMFDNKAKGSNHRTSIMLVNKNGEIKNSFELKSNGDTGYPGLLTYNHQLWISYYSSHEGKASIYLAKIKLKDLIFKNI
jgi:hypothetical protein